MVLFVIRRERRERHGWQGERNCIKNGPLAVAVAVALALAFSVDGNPQLN